MLLQRAHAGAGRPIVDNCMGGYNSSIFAYGQTGAGKTYTMQGPLTAAGADDDGSEQRGLAPRVFQYLFSEIDKAQDDNVSLLAGVRACACPRQQQLRAFTRARPFTFTFPCAAPVCAFRRRSARSATRTSRSAAA
jgi:hypothetical protein